MFSGVLFIPNVVKPIHTCIYYIAVLVRIIIAYGVSPPIGAFPCSQNWVGYGTKCYFFVEHPMAFANAESSCKDAFGHLAVVNDRYLNVYTANAYGFNHFVIDICFQHCTLLSPY